MAPFFNNTLTLPTLKDSASRDAAIMLIILPIVVFRNAQNFVQLCLRWIPIMLNLFHNICGRRIGLCFTLPGDASMCGGSLVPVWLSNGMGVRNYASYNHLISRQKPHPPIIARKFTHYACIMLLRKPTDYAQNSVCIIAASLSASLLYD